MAAFMCSMSFFSKVMFFIWGPDLPNWLLCVAVAPSRSGVAEVLTNTLIILTGGVDKADSACSTGSEHG